MDITAKLYEIMPAIHPGVEDLALYEFRYCLNNLTPESGWEALEMPPMTEIEQQVASRAFYDRIQIKPKVDGRVVPDINIVRLNRQLLAGLASGIYPVEWVKRHFYFDLRGFYFLHRTQYFSPQAIERFGGEPLCCFEPKQRAFERRQSIGYKEFMAANAEVDALFLHAMRVLSDGMSPVVLGIAGPTAAGKTEIVERLMDAFARDGLRSTTLELDNFLTDRDEREAKGIFTQGKEAFHMLLMRQALEALRQGQAASTPRYDTVFAISSHDNAGLLKPDGRPITVPPADIIFIEGNFPFLFDEIAPLVDVKAVYLTDDPVRLQRKWKRDIDYRRKYEPTYFRNRYFKDQFIMAEIAYRPQIERCDLCVDTTGATLWARPSISAMLMEKGSG